MRLLKYQLLVNTKYNYKILWCITHIAQFYTNISKVVCIHCRNLNCTSATSVVQGNCSSRRNIYHVLLFPTNNLSDYLLNTWYWWYWGNCVHQVNAIKVGYCRWGYSIHEQRISVWLMFHVIEGYREASQGICQDVCREAVTFTYFYVLHVSLIVKAYMG